jgi:hypothetical protein
MVDNDSRSKLAAVRRRAMAMTEGRTADSPPARVEHDILLRTLHAECPAATASEMAEAERFIRRLCGC